MEETLGKRIARNRKSLGLTQEQLAEQLGVTAQAVSKWENDQSCPDIAILPQLADIFGISVDELLGRDTPRKVYQGEIVGDGDGDGDDDDDDDESEGIHIHNGKWEFRWDQGRRGALTFAIWALMVGGLLLTVRLLSWDVSFWDILWPSFLLVYGLDGLFRKFTLFRSCMVLFGGYYLISNLGIWSLNLAGELVWPILILMFGLSMLIDAIKKPKKHHFHIHKKGHLSGKTEDRYNEEKDSFDTSVNFGENTRVIKLPRLVSGSAEVNFGELTIDLTQCAAIADGCRLDVKCSFGQLVLLIPKTCRVISDASAAMGAVEFDGESNVDAATTIYLDGKVSMGDLKIRYV